MMTPAGADAAAPRRSGSGSGVCQAHVGKCPLTFQRFASLLGREAARVGATGKIACEETRDKVKCGIEEDKCCK